MNPDSMMFRIISFLFFAATGSQPGFSQARVFLQNSSVALDACMQVNFEIRGKSAWSGSPDFPEIRGFDKSGKSQSESSSLGEITRTFRQLYRPKKTGTFVIPEIRYEYPDGKTYTSPVFSIVVSAAGGDPGAGCESLAGSDSKSLAEFLKPAPVPIADLNSLIRGKDFVLDVRIHGNKKFVRQQLLLECTLYFMNEKVSGITVRDENLDAMMQSIVPEGIQYEILSGSGNGDRVAVPGSKFMARTLFAMALFSGQPGVFSFPETSLEFEYLSLNSSDYISAYGQTSAKEIEVLPLPSYVKNRDLPVGRFEMESRPLTRDILTGETMNLEIVVRGTSTSDDIPDLPIRFDPSLELYETTAESELYRNPRALISERAFRYTLVAKKSGEITLENIDFVFFDPWNERLDTIRLEKRLLKISGKDLEAGGFSLGSFYQKAIEKSGTAGPKKYSGESLAWLLLLLLGGGSFAYYKIRTSAWMSKYSKGSHKE